MSQTRSRYLLLEQGVGSAFINFVLNAAIAWAMFRGWSVVPLWGQQSIAGDTAGTTFFLPFFTCLIVTRMTTKHVRSGRVPAFSWSRASHPVLRLMPDTTVRRAVLLGFLAMALVAPPVVWGLSALHVLQLPFWSFIVFKATFAAALAAVVTPLIGLCAIADVSGAQPSPAV